MAGFPPPQWTFRVSNSRNVKLSQPVALNIKSKVTTPTIMRPTTHLSKDSKRGVRFASDGLNLNLNPNPKVKSFMTGGYYRFLYQPNSRQ
jgi:hypothetical protein